MQAPPAHFVRRIHKAFGAEGDAWLGRLPALLVDLSRQWDLELGEPFELSYNYVTAAGQADGTPAVLKIGVPVAEIRRELPALRAYGGDGACRVLEADAERCAMLLERVAPGDMLAGLVRTDDDEATRIGARLLR